MAKYDLKPTRQSRHIVEQGIILANVALSHDVPFRFAPAWSGHEWNLPLVGVRADPDNSARRIVVGPQRYEFVNFEPIPVNLVDDEQLGSTESSFIPEGGRCVIFRAGAIPDLLDSFGLAGRLASPHPSYEQAKVVAIILLHEAGHLSVGGHGTTPASQHPATSGSSVEAEVSADAFAVRQIQAAIDSASSDADAEWVGGGAKAVASGLHRIIDNATNVNDLRFDPWGYLDRHAKPHVFSPTGYTHLNLRLRFEIMAYQLDPREQKRILLTSILRKSPSPEVGRITPEAARSNVGAAASVCGVIASAEYDKDAGGSPTVLYFERSYPNDPLRLVIWGADRGAFDNPERLYPGKRLCVACVIRRDRRGTLYAVVSRPADITLDADGRKGPG